MPKRSTITWLHLSDLHACKPKTGWDARRVLVKLQEDLHKMGKEYGLRPDMIFFTGDAAYGHIGNERDQLITDQFRHANDFLTGVRQCFDPEIPIRNLFIVPGNHDVNIKRISRFETQWLDSLHKSKSDPLVELEAIIRSGGNDWSRLVAPLDDYRNFLEQYGYEHLLTEKERLIYADIREISGLRVGIAGFNSAWSSRGIGREELGRLWMAGRFQLELLHEKLHGCDLRIALIHHPANWFAEPENPQVFREIGRDFEFILHGHEHSHYVQAEAINGHSIIAAGACHEWSQSSRNGYNFVQIDLANNQGNVWLRTYDSVGAGWVPCHINGRTDDRGRWPLNHISKWLAKAGSESEPEPGTGSDVDAPIKTVSGMKPKFDYESRYRKAVAERLNAIQLIGIDAGKEAREYSLSVAYVTLSLSDECDDGDEDSGQDDSGEGENAIMAEALFQRLNGETKRLLIRGVAGSGKSTLLKWAAVQAGRGAAAEGWQSKVPFMIRFRDYAKKCALPRPQQYPLILAKELPDAPTGWVEDVLEHGRGLIMFDGVDEVPHLCREKLIREVQHLIAAYPENTYIVTTRPEAVERGEFHSMGFVAARVEPLSTEDRSALIDRWHEAMEDRLQKWNKPTDLRPRASRLKSRLDDSPAVARLATNPLLCAAVCALHYYRNENLPETPVDLCEKICEMLIYRRDTERGISLADGAALPALDYQKQKGLLARIAYRMIISGASTIDEAEAIGEVSLGLEAFGISSPAAKAPVLLKALIERTGMLQESSDGHIEFLHNTLKEYLAAEIFVNAADVATLARHAKDEAWRPVVLFAVALPRTGSKFAVQLVRAIRDVTALGLPDSIVNDATHKSELFFLYRCCVSAHQLDDDELRNVVSQLLRQLVPPSNMTQAQSLASCGEYIVPYLEYKREWSARQRAACVRALGQIGGNRAKRCLATYSRENALTVINEMISGPAAGIAPSLTSGDYYSLIFSKKYIGTLEPLRGLPHLATLDFSSAFFRASVDFSVLSEIRSLRNLVLRDSKGANDFSSLSRLNLEYLDLSNTSISELSPLSGMAVRSLGLSGTKVSDLDPLKGNQHLAVLYFGHTPVHSLRPCGEMNGLRELSLQKTGVTDISPLGNLVEMRILDIHDNAIRDISSLAGLVDLAFLLVSDTQISALDGVEGLTALEMLDLGGTLISDISLIDGLKNLRWLSLRETRVDDVSSLARLESIQWLDLADTRVEDVSCLRGLGSLQVINCRGTPAAVKGCEGFVRVGRGVLFREGYQKRLDGQGEAIFMQSIMQSIMHSIMHSTREWRSHYPSYFWSEIYSRVSRTLR